MRRGEIPFEQWWSRTRQLDAQLEQMLGDDTLAERPDFETIDTWSVATHLRLWEQRKQL